MTGGILLRRWGSAPAILLACLGLAACSDDRPGVSATTPSVQPAETPSATATATATATKPALVLGKPTADSAVGFVRYFIAAYNYAYATYDTSLLEDISQRTCKFCSGIVSDVHRLQKAGTSVTGTEVTFVEVAFPSKAPIKSGTYLVLVSSQKPGTSRLINGKTQPIDGSTNSQTEIGLDWTGGKWLIRGARVTKKGSAWRA